MTIALPDERDGDAIVARNRPEHMNALSREAAHVTEARRQGVPGKGRSQEQ